MLPRREAELVAAISRQKHKPIARWVADRLIAFCRTKDGKAVQCLAVPPFIAHTSCGIHALIWSVDPGSFCGHYGACGTRGPSWWAARVARSLLQFTVKGFIVRSTKLLGSAALASSASALLLLASSGAAVADHTHVKVVGNGGCVVIAEGSGEASVDLPNAVFTGNPNVNR